MASKLEERSHAPGETRSVASEPVTPMLCPDPTRDTVSAAGCGRAEAMPNARRR
jgi:hypothetical protein